MSRSRKHRGWAWVGLAAALAVTSLVLIAGWWASTPHPTGFETPRQMAEASARQTSRSPADASAWLRSAAADAVLQGRCDRRCSEALGRSFDAAPLDMTLFPWRTRFALEYWSDLPPPLRLRVQRHIEIAWTVRPGRRDIQGLTRVVASPAGRLTINLLAANLKARESRPPAIESLG
jgi:hypothetical protein